MDRTFTRIFDATGRELAKTAIGRMVQSLQQGVEGELDILPAWSTDVSYQEAAILAILGAFQARSADRAFGLIANLVCESERTPLADSAAGFAFALASAGYRLPPDDRAAPTLTPTSSLHGRSALGGPPWLTLEEAVIVTGARIWVQALKANKSYHDALRMFFDRQGIGAATSGLHTILDHTGHSATRSLNVHCPACPCLSVDEARLLCAVAAMQRGDRLTAMGELASWLPHQVAQLTVRAVGGLATNLAAAGVLLPWRDWEFREDRSREPRPITADTPPEGWSNRPTIH